MIYIIIPVHNRINLTIACLKSLQAQTFIHFKTIIVDDGSSDGTESIISEKFPTTIILKGNGNLWWTAAINMGVNFALEDSNYNDNDFILTLNNDLELPERYLELIIEDFHRFKPCLVGSTSVDINNRNKLLYAGLKQNYYISGYREIAKDFTDYNDLLNKRDYVLSDNLPGRGTLISFKILKKIGVFDQANFMHYMADIEFSERAKKNGFKNIVSVKACLYENYETTGMHIDRLTFFEFIKKMNLKTSNVYLPIRYKYAILYSKTKYIYFVLDFLRLILSYLLRRFNLKH